MYQCFAINNRKQQVVVSLAANRCESNLNYQFEAVRFPKGRMHAQQTFPGLQNQNKNEKCHNITAFVYSALRIETVLSQEHKLNWT